MTTPAHTDAVEIARAHYHPIVQVPGWDDYSPRINHLAALIEPKLRERDARIAALTEERDALQSTITACEDEVAKVYWHITDSKFSKMNTRAEVIIDEYEEKLAAAREDGAEPHAIKNSVQLANELAQQLFPELHRAMINHAGASNPEISEGYRSIQSAYLRKVDLLVNAFSEQRKALKSARQTHNEEGKG